MAELNEEIGIVIDRLTAAAGRIATSDPERSADLLDFASKFPVLKGHLDAAYVYYEDGHIERPNV